MNRRDHWTDVVYGSRTGPTVLPGMYEVSTRKASPTESACRQKNIPAAIGTENHLCAPHVIESAASMRARLPRGAGELMPAPPHGAWTGNHSLPAGQNGP